MLKALLRFFIKLCFRVKVVGEDASAFDNERTLIIANHESFLDGLLIALFLPVEATFMVHSTVLQNGLFRWLLQHAPHLPVDTNNPLLLKQAVRLIETGKPVAIFPEGRLTVTGSLMKVYDGAAFLAARTGAAVVPVRIQGAGRSYLTRLSGIHPRRLFPQVTLTILPKRFVQMPQRSSARARRRRAGEIMRTILLEMLVATRRNVTFYEAFLEAKELYGSNYKLIEDMRLVEESYGSLLKMTLALERALAKVPQLGTNVGVLMPNLAVTLAVVLALSKSGRVPAMLNYTAGREGLSAACVAAQIQVIVTLRAFVEKAKLAAILDALPGVRVICLEGLRSELTALDKIAVFVRTLAPRRGVASRQPEDPALILFTSGSEGKPKGVVHSHASLLANVAQVRSMADFNPLDKFFVALPLFHSFGFTGGALLPLMSGCRAFFYPSPLHYRAIPEVVYDRDCTVLFGTSTFLGNYARFAHPYDFGRLRYVISGAEKLSEAVRKSWIDIFGIRILEGYGATECGPVLAVNTPMGCRPGSVGKMVPLMRYVLEPAPGIDRGGVLHVSGPNVMLGYLRYERPGVLERTDSSGRGGWYCTGDIVEIDEDDFVYVRGRVKRFAKVAGEMVSLEAVENVIAQGYPNATHAVVSRPDARKGEELVLFTTADLAREDLRGLTKREGVPELAVPAVIRRLDALPTLGTGKTDYVKLNALAREPEAATQPA